MGPFPLKGSPGDDGATSFRNGDLKKRLRVSVIWPKPEEDFELDVSRSHRCGVALVKRFRGHLRYKNLEGIVKCIVRFRSQGLYTVNIITKLLVL